MRRNRERSNYREKETEREREREREMRKRRERKRETSETRETRAEEGHDEIGKEEDKEEKGGFFACYLLCSRSPRFKGHTYIGFTNNPRRRIRQHNGEIRSGAWRTKNKRPWEMILCIYGFPTNVSALQFEWAWQHPTESLAVRKAAASFKCLSGIANKIKLAYTMLTLLAWQRLNLTVNFFSTKYKKHSAGCPSLPEHMKVQICPMDELPCYREGGVILDDNIDDWEGEDDEKGGNGHSKEGLMDISICNTSESQCSIEKVADERSGGLIVDENIDDWQYEDEKGGNGHLKETLKHIPVYDTSEYLCNIEKAAHERLGWIEDDVFRRPRDPHTPRKDHGEPFRLVDSPMETVFSSITRSFDRLGSVEDRDLFGLIDNSSNNLGQLTKQHPTTPDAFGNNQSPTTNSILFSPEVEIINMFTSTSDRIIRSRRRKKRPSAFPQIIDLTKSPLFIQL